ncbi:STAS domain-containing protein [Micromonospora sp. ALFpr18c]|uniref:STAS domain-containing protein n=1 Tax=unclassified Micromonospora TaxID=2617518 RepID=UPI001CECE257|nr:STAS domain-containing protein [Micromonospora sp. ALFpr18c]
MKSPVRRPRTNPLTTTVDLSDPNAPLIRVGGELAYATSAPLRVEVDRLLADAPPTVVLDFADLHFIDSTGLAVIVYAWREGRQVGTAIRLRAVPRFLASILDITGVAGLLARPLPQARPTQALPTQALPQARPGDQRPAASA